MTSEYSLNGVVADVDLDEDHAENLSFEKNIAM
jgi:hypothetical protein